MPVFISQDRANEVRALATLVADQMDAVDVRILLNGGLPVVWLEGERLDIMKWATLLAFLSEIDIACYPLSASAVLFIEP